MPIRAQNNLLLAVCTLMFIGGCRLSTDLKSWQGPIQPRNPSIATFLQLASQQQARATPLAMQSVQAPTTVADVQNAPRLMLSLQDVVQQALTSDYVVRSLGGQVVSQPGNATTAIDPTLVQTNAIAGEQAALSEFDAIIKSNLTFTRADRGIREQVFLSDATAVDNLFANYDSVIEKRTRHGTVFGLRRTVDYDSDNLGAPANRLNSSYDNSVGLEMRHPLAKGGGRAFNEIAGPGARAGQYRGILIAQANTNIAVHDFRIALRDHLHDVVRTYWGLYLSYADLDAKSRSLEAAKNTLEIARKKQKEGLFDADAVFQAEERFHAAEAAYLDAISGAPNRSTVGILGVSGSSLAGADSGILALERRLRFQLGLPPSDGWLIQPSDAPSPAPLVFDWNQAVSTAVSRRPELSRQSHVVNKKRMELKAAKNFLLPKFDAVAQYRFRGFGDNYFEDGQDDSGAFEELFNGDLQEWVAGVEFEWPAGNRIGREAVRNARLSLARELGILEQQQHQISHELASVFSELNRAYIVRKSAAARYEAARRHEQAMAKKFAVGLPVDIETVLDAQRLAAESRAGFHVAEVDCEVAVLKVNVAKATFLSQCNISLQSEHPLPICSHNTLPPSTATASQRSEPINHDASKQIGGMYAGPTATAAPQRMPDVRRSIPATPAVSSSVLHPLDPGDQILQTTVAMNPTPRRLPPTPRRLPSTPRRLPSTPRRLPSTPRRLPSTPRRLPSVTEGPALTPSVSDGSDLQIKSAVRPVRLGMPVITK